MKEKQFSRIQLKKFWYWGGKILLNLASVGGGGLVWYTRSRWVDGDDEPHNNNKYNIIIIIIEKRREDRRLLALV